MIDHTIYYIIADLQLELLLPSEYEASVILPNFEPFKNKYDYNKDVNCRVHISRVDIDFNVKSAKLLSDISIIWGERFSFYETDDFYYTLIQFSDDKTKHWKMRSTKDFSCNTIYCGPLAKRKNNFISWYIMVAFAQSGLLHKCVLFHASVVMENRFAYAFLGKSGTGKSTHSRLWIKYIDGMSLLNDDNPAIRIIDNNVLVFGTPWSGKTPCYKSEARLLHGLVRLKQAPHNKFDIRKNKEALMTLLPSCSAIRWNLNLYSTLVNILIEIISITPIGELECLPNEEAAMLCFTELKKI